MDKKELKKLIKGKEKLKGHRVQLFEHKTGKTIEEMLINCLYNEMSDPQMAKYLNGMMKHLRVSSMEWHITSSHIQNWRVKLGLPSTYIGPGRKKG